MPFWVFQCVNLISLVHNDDDSDVSLDLVLHRDLLTGLGHRLSSSFRFYSRFTDWWLVATVGNMLSTSCLGSRTCVVMGINPSSGLGYCYTGYSHLQGHRVVIWEGLKCELSPKWITPQKPVIPITVKVCFDWTNRTQRLWWEIHSE